MQPPVPSCASAIAIAIALSGAFPLAAHGEVRVEGNPAGVRISTSQDSIGNVLAALGTFNIHYRSAIKLDAAANPTYAVPSTG